MSKIKDEAIKVAEDAAIKVVEKAEKVLKNVEEKAEQLKGRLQEDRNNRG